jgi:hypothetical protein
MAAIMLPAGDERALLGRPTPSNVEGLAALVADSPGSDGGVANRRRNPPWGDV